MTRATRKGGTEKDNIVSEYDALEVIIAGMPTPWLALVACFTWGFAALLYQVIWQRLLAIFSGADVYSATVIVAAFIGHAGER